MKTILNTLYVQSQGTYLRLDHDTVALELDGQTRQVPLHHLGAIFVFGNVLVSPFLVHRCGEDGRALAWFSRGGRFRARIAGPTAGNILLRQAQHAAATDPATCLSIGRFVVAGKLQNARGTLMRAARDAGLPTDRAALSAAAAEHAIAIRALPAARSLDEVRGLEGAAARAYFGVFAHMVRASRAEFTPAGRSRRPPLDRMNALLSFAYALVTSDCVAACEGAGLDPQLGFLHAVRPGRPSLALDLVEELRSCLADRLALTLVNRQQLQPTDFVVRPGGAVNLSDDGRATVLAAYQRRKAEEVRHPVTGSSVPFGLLPHVQARLLARHLRGDAPTYAPLVLR